jgi:hypothetical protein
MTNFFEGDIILYLTYKPKFAPKTLGEAETRRRNYIRRVAYLCRKRGLDAPKVIWVAEYGEEGGNLHHHILIHCELSRDELESLWRDTKSGESLGFTRSVRIQGEAESIDDLAGYISKNFGCSDDGEISPAYTGDEPDAKPKRGRPKNKRRWGGSTNLLRPQEKTNDSAYSRREVERIAKAQPSREDWEKRYPGWTTINGDSAVKYYYNEITGWYIRLRMKRKAVCRREE